jgi:glycosyltransferase involved in cell wall biosynthesis
VTDGVIDGVIEGGLGGGAEGRLGSASDGRLGRLVFAHDNRFVHGPDGRVWSDRGSFPWDRYLEIASHVTVVSRMRKLERGESTESMVLASRPEVDFVPLPNLATLSGRLRVARRRAVRRQLAEVLATSDALVARLPSEIGGLACRVAASLDMVWAVELVTCPWDAIWNYGSWKGRAFAPVAWWETRRLLRRAPFALYVTSSFLQRRYPPGSSTHAVGVSDVEITVPGPEVLERRLARIEAGSAASGRPVVFGTIAALLRFKGLDTAAAALRQSGLSGLGAVVRVLGSGDPAGFEGPGMVFDGTLPSGGPVQEWLDSIDVYLQPSRQEGLPRGLVEAMARGCPAVGSTAGGIPELLDPSCLHQPGDAAALALLLGRAADPEWQRAQAQRNVAVAAGYAPEVLDERRRAFWQAFRSAARGRGGRGGRSGRAGGALLVTPYAQLGGSEGQLLHLVDGVAPDEVAGVVTLQEGPLLERLPAWIEPVVLPTGPGLRDVVRAAWRLRRVVRSVRPGVVHGSCAKGALVAGLAVIGTGVPVVFAKHDFYWDGPVAWFTALLSARVVAGSEALVAPFPRWLRSRLAVVHPGVAPVEELAESTVAGERSPGAIAMVARFHPDKGQMEIVEALVDVPGARLALVGGVDTSTPSFLDEVQARVVELGLGERVAFLGHRDDVLSILAMCEVVVVPSLVPEGFGLVAVEAFRAGTPVVAYANGALAEVVGDAGVLVPVGDRAGLAAAVSELLADPGRRAELASRGRERAELFTVEAMVAGMRTQWARARDGR